MANCKRCSAELIGVMKFCATCGAPVEAAKSVVDPFAQTAEKKNSEAMQADLPQHAVSVAVESAAPVSPLAVSNIFPAAAPVSREASRPAHPVSMPTPPLHVIHTPQPANPMTQPLPSHPMPVPTPVSYGAASFAPTAAQPAVAPFVPTMRVLVLWSDGQRYPGVVAHVNDRQCLVSFGDGSQRWVDMQYLSRA